MAMGRGGMRGGWPCAGVAMAALIAAGSASAAPVPQELAACGTIAGAGERLACFDRYLATARTEGVATADRPARNSSRPPRPAPVRDLVSTVGGVTPFGQGRWTLVLADKSVWQTYDAGAPEPRAGQPVHIRKGTLGSYIADIGGARGVVLKRVR